MKYGLLYYKDTDNIGDDIQSYAASRFLPRIDYLIDRDHAREFIPDCDEKVKVIMNAWYSHERYNFGFSPYINPLLISMHFKKFDYEDGITIKDDYINENDIKYLKENGPVGCRDNYTKELLKSRGIETYLSGCMTLTIDLDKEKHDMGYICAVNLSKKEIAKIKKNTNREIKIINQDVKKGTFSKMSWEDRKKNVENLLEIYLNAHFVVTTKLHCALPCLALETPVLLLYEDKNADRMETFLPLLSHIKREEFSITNDELENPEKNPNKYKKFRKSLINSLHEFINSTINNKINNNYTYKEMLEFSNNEKNWIINQLQYLQKQYVSECKKASITHDNIEELNTVIAETNNKITKLEDKVKIKDNYINDLKETIIFREKEIKEIKESKGYKLLEKLRNIINRKKWRKNDQK